jgi:hypothetical protein
VKTLKDVGPTWKPSRLSGGRSGGKEERKGEWH